MGEDISPDYIDEIRRLWQQSLRIDVDRAQVNFALADRLNDEIPVSANEANNGRYEPLQIIADAIYAPFETLRVIQWVGARWPHGA